MLQQIREKSGSWIIKIILGLIGASFVVFGLVDAIRILTALPPIAKVGGAKIEFQEFHQAYQRQLSALGQRHITLKSSAQKKQMVKQLLDRLVEEKVMTQEPQKRGILVPKNLVSEYLRSIPYFQKDGQFDAATFQEIMRRSGASPQQFVANISNDLAMQQLLGPLVAALKMEASSAEKLTEILFRKRRFEVVIIEGMEPKQEVPDDVALTRWMKDRKADYMKPSQRGIEVILLSHKALAEKVVVTEEDLRQAYQDRKDEFTTPGECTIMKVSFESESDANAAVQLMTGEFSEEKLKKEYPEARLEKVTAQDLNPEDADMVSHLRVAEPFGPVLRGGQWVIFVVTQRTEPVTKTYEEVKDEVEKEYRKFVVSQRLQGTKEQIEDALARGTSLDEVAKEFPIELKAFPALTKKDMSEKLATSLSPEVVEIVAAQAFQQEKGEESDFYDVPDYSFILRVVDVKKKAWPELQEVRARVVNDWLREKSRSRTRDHASLVYGSVKSSADWKEALKKEHAKAKEYTLSLNETYKKDHELFKILTPNDIDRMMLLKNGAPAFFDVNDSSKEKKKVSLAVVFPVGSSEDVGSKLDTQKLEQRERFNNLFMRSFDEEAALLVQRSIVMGVPVKINKDSLKKVQKSLSDNEN